MESDTIVESVPQPPLAPEAQATPGGGAVAAILVVGAFGVVLSWAPSELFDLDRYLVPKALALHLTAFILLAIGAVPLRRSTWDLPTTLLAAFVAWSALSAALATNRWLAIAAWGVSFSSAIVFLAARTLPERLRWPVLGGLLGAVVVGAGLGMAQAYGLEAAWLSDSRPPGGTFGNRNFLGHLAAIAAPALLMWTVCTRRSWTAALGVLGTAVLAAAIVLTRSRAAWLGGLGGVTTALIGLWWVGRRTPSGGRALRLSAAGAAAVGAIAGAVLVPNELDWRTDSPYASTLTRLTEFQQGSGRGRLIQYRNSLALVPRNPLFGSGPGNWFVDYPLVTSRGDPAYAGADLIPTNPWPSSDWVALLAERGAAGALLLLLAGGAALVAVLRGDGGPDHARRPAAAGAVAGVLSAALICGAFDAVLILASPAYLTWAAVGLLLPRAGAPSGPLPHAWRTAAPVAAAPPSGRGWATHAGTAAATAVALALVVYAGAHTAAVALTAPGTRTATLTRAARFAPGEHRLQLVLGQRGRCANARRAAGLMPNHTRAVRLAERCG